MGSRPGWAPAERGRETAEPPRRWRMWDLRWLHQGGPAAAPGARAVPSRQEPRRSRRRPPRWRGHAAAVRLGHLAHDRQARAPSRAGRAPSGRGRSGRTRAAGPRRRSRGRGRARRRSPSRTATSIGRPAGSTSRRCRAGSTRPGRAGPGEPRTSVSAASRRISRPGCRRRARSAASLDEQVEPHGLERLLGRPVAREVDQVPDQPAQLVELAGHVAQHARALGLGQRAVARASTSRFVRTLVSGVRSSCEASTRAGAASASSGRAPGASC